MGNGNGKRGNTGSPHGDCTLKMIRILRCCTFVTFMEGLHCVLVPIALIVTIYTKANLMTTIMCLLYKF